MGTIVSRPKSEKHKINSKNEFELCYLRHQYIRKVKYNPSKEEMEPYEAICKNIAKHTFFTYRNLFHLVGMESEDLINIAQTHLVSFLGLFAMEKMPEKYDDFTKFFKRKEGRKVNQLDLSNKNKANFTLFIKQRMGDVVRICRQKARNIKGYPTEEYKIFYGPSSPPIVLRNLLENHEKLGFKKLDSAAFRTIKKHAKPDNDKIFQFEGNWYVCVPSEQKNLSLMDLCGAGLDPHDNMHNMNPEEFMNQTYWEDKKDEFSKYSKHKKTSTMKKFIELHQNNPDYTDELKAARKILRELKQNG